VRLVHLSDLHVTEGPRLEDQREVLARLMERVIDLGGCHAWLLTGDLYGRTVPHRSTPAERGVLFPFLARAAEMAPVVVVVGNHDVAEDLAGLEHLGGLWPIHVSAAAEVGDVETDAGTLRTYCLPYPTKRWLLAGQDAPRGLVDAQLAVQQRLALLCTAWGSRVSIARLEEPDVVHVVAAHVNVVGCRTSGGEVMAGQEIELTAPQLEEIGADYVALGHLHFQQEVAHRAWYAGSPWRTDFAESEDKGALVVDVGYSHPPDGEEILRTYTTSDNDAAARVEVTRLATHARKLVTLEYRWGFVENGGAEPTWTQHPQMGSDGGGKWVTRLYGLEVAGAEVRARLVVPAQLVQTCPWDEEIEQLRQAGAHRIVIERVIEPVLRMRSQSITTSRTVREKLTAYWSTLGTKPTLPEMDAAIGALGDLEQLEDTEITEGDAERFLLRKPVPVT
jgi:exonuclease SbcD